MSILGCQDISDFSFFGFDLTCLTCAWKTSCAAWLRPRSCHSSLFILGLIVSKNDPNALLSCREKGLPVIWQHLLGSWCIFSYWRFSVFHHFQTQQITCTPKKRNHLKWLSEYLFFLLCISEMENAQLRAVIYHWYCLSFVDVLCISSWRMAQPWMLRIVSAHDRLAYLTSLLTCCWIDW